MKDGKVTATVLHLPSSILFPSRVTLG